MKIMYSDKEDIVGLPEVDIKNKVTAADMNEIKNVVNANSETTEELKDAKVPIGFIMQVSDVANLPDNWWSCDGQSLSKVDYSELYQIIGNMYGSTAETFSLPNQNKTSVKIDAALIPKFYYIIRAK